MPVKSAETQTRPFAPGRAGRAVFEEPVGLAARGPLQKFARVIRNRPLGTFLIGSLLVRKKLGYDWIKVDRSGFFLNV